MYHPPWCGSSFSFSSRRRHTRLTCDWSSDVCSSDLEEFVAIVGPSGCGKSTILNMIAGLVEPSAGVIEIDGWPVTGVPANVGCVFQKGTVFPWRTVRRNIALGLEYRGIRGDAQERR